MMTKFRFFLMLMILSILSPLLSCKTSGKSEKFYEKQADQKAMEEQAEYNGRVEKHYDMQSESTKKMLKKTNKEAKKLNRSKRPKSKPC